MDQADVQSDGRSPIEPGQKLQILSSEMASLVAARSLAWSEAFSRTTMFLATLSGAMVALALAAQASEFGSGFRVFAVVVLPVVLFVGVTTAMRIGASNYHDAMCVMGMNKIRAAYLEMAPDLARHFVTGTSESHSDMLKSMGIPPHQPNSRLILSATPTLIAVINAILGAVIVVFGVSFFDVPVWIEVIGGLAGFAVVFGAHQRFTVRSIAAGRQTLTPSLPD
jgi:hypothetical protein